MCSFFNLGSKLMTKVGFSSSPCVVQKFQMRCFKASKKFLRKPYEICWLGARKNGQKFAMFMYERNLMKKSAYLLYIDDEILPSNVGIIVNYLVVSNIFYVHPYLGKWSNLTNIFQMGWNQKLVNHSKDPYETPSISMESKLPSNLANPWMKVGFLLQGIILGFTKNKNKKLEFLTPKVQCNYLLSMSMTI